MALRSEREKAYADALLRRENARRAYAQLVAHHKPLDPDAHHDTVLALHSADLALDAASRAVMKIKQEIDLARLDYEGDRLSGRGGRR